jgi:AAA domain
MQLQSIKCEMFRQKSCFKLKPFKDLKVGSERHYLVNGFIPRVGTTVIWGKPKTGKTFVVSDLVMHVAAMPPFSKSANTKELGHLLQPIVALVEMRP